MLQHERAEAYLSTVEEMRKAKRYASRSKGKGKETASDTEDGSDEEQDYPQFEEWYGHERIAGLSSPASQAVISSLLEIGTAMRRLEERIAEIREQTAKMLVPESSALCHAIEVVLEWVAGWLRAFEPAARREGQGILGLERGFKELRALLMVLLDLLGCVSDLNVRPPTVLEGLTSPSLGSLSHESLLSRAAFGSTIRPAFSRTYLPTTPLQACHKLPLSPNKHCSGFSKRLHIRGERTSPPGLAGPACQNALQTLE